MKRILKTAFVPLLAVLCFVLPMRTEAAEVASGTCGNNLTWILDDEGTLTISGTGPMDFSFYPPWRSYQDQITTVCIGDGVTSIDNYAFEDCVNLTGKISIPDSITSIGNYAFENCSGLTGELLIPDSVTSIGSRAFYGCSGLTGDLVIPANVTNIGSYAFNDCSGFTGKLSIPNGVTNIDSGAFGNCSNLTGTLVIPESVTGIGSFAFYNCSGFTGNLVIPESITSISSYTFYGCSGFSGDLIISEGITDIGNHAFCNCSGFEGELVLPEGVISIGSDAFRGCSGLSGELRIPDSVTSIGSSAFDGCRGFTGQLIIPGNVTSIDGGAFSYCSGFTGELVISAGVASIGTSAFHGCEGLSGELVFPESITSIGSAAFYDCDGITKMTFLGTTPPAEIAGDFSLMYRLETVCVPEGSLRDYIVALAGKLPEWAVILTADGEENSIANGTCGEELIWTLTDYGTLTIFGNGDMEDYSSYDSPWVEYGDQITEVVIESGVTSVSDCAFCDAYECLEEVILADTVTSIGEAAFADLPNLLYINLEHISQLGSYAFLGCSGLSEITFGDMLTEIPQCAFEGCSSLSSIELPANLTAIGAGAFAGCGLETLTFPKTLKELSDGAFGSNDNLQEITFTGNAPSISDDAFCYVEAVVYYPANDTTWTGDKIWDYGGSLTWAHPTTGKCGDNATWHFDKDTGTLSISGTGAISDNIASGWHCFGYELLRLEIGDGITRIGDYAFSNCEYLTEITFHGKSVPSFEAEKAFPGFYSLEIILVPHESLAEYIIALPNFAEIIRSEIPSGQCGDTAAWALTEDGVMTISGTGAMWDGYYSSLLEYLDEIKRLVVKEGITHIGDYSFSGCSNLVEITLPESLTSVGERAFEGCVAVSEVTIPDGVTSMGTNAFAYCEALEKVIIPEGLTVLEDSTFMGCTSLTNVTLPESVTEIEAYAFMDCSNLKTVNLPQNLKVLGNHALSGCTSLTSVALPQSLTVLNEGVFSSCTSLTQITVPANVTKIEKYAFSCGDNLESVTFVGNAPSFNWYSFSGTTTTVYYPSNDESWNSYVMCDYSGDLTWTCYCINDHVVVIDEKLNATCTETGLTEGSHCSACSQILVAQEVIEALGHKETIAEAVPVTCTEDGLTEGKYCSVCEEVFVWQEVLYAPGHAEVFVEAVEPTCTESGLTESVYCSVCDEVLVDQEVIPELGHDWSVWTDTEPDCANPGTEIHSCYICGEEKKEDIPALGHSYEMDFCTVCGEIDPSIFPISGTSGRYVSWTLTRDGVLTFTGTGDMETVNWGRYADYVKSVVITEGITSIVNDAFSVYHCPNGCGYRNIKDISLPKSINTIGENAFSSCSSLQSVTIPTNVTTIEYGTFEGCASLVSVSLPNGITSIMSNAFSYCDSLETITIPQSVVSIGSRAFSDSGLKEIAMPNAVSYIGSRAFSNCTDLQKISILNGGTNSLEIGSYCFEYCQNLKEISLPLTVSEIGSNAFIECRNLNDVYYNGTEADRAAIAIGSNNSWLTGAAWHYSTPICTHLATESYSQEDATCTQNGYTAGVFCNDCNSWISGHEEIPAKGHTEVIDKAQEATCTEYGLTEGKHCSVCETVLLEQKEIAILGHSYGNWKLTKSSTCTEAGEERRDCVRCYSFEMREIAVKSHTEVVDKAVDATCTTDGLTEGSHCSFCGEVLVAQEEIPANGHNYGTPVFTWDDNFSCTAVFTCKNCGDGLSITCTVTSITGGNPIQTVYTAKVDLNGRSYTDTKNILAETPEHTTHNAGSQWFSDNDSHWKQCTGCEEKMDISAHIPGTEATENSSQKCSICGYALQTPLGLDWFFEKLEEPNNYLWATGYYAKIMEQYG